MAKLNWPAILFVAAITLGAGLWAISFFYAESEARIEANYASIAKNSADYTRRVDELKQKSIVEGTETIPLPSATIERDCGFHGIFGVHVCVPNVGTIVHNLPKVIKAASPQVTQELRDQFNKIATESKQNSQEKERIKNLKATDEFAQNMMKPIVSLIILVASIYIILSRKYNADHEKWAFGSLGTIIGLWLKH